MFHLELNSKKLRAGIALNGASLGSKAVFAEIATLCEKLGAARRNSSTGTLAVNKQMYKRIRGLFRLGDVQEVKGLLFAFTESAMVRQAVESMELSYGGVLRKNLEPAVIHPLRVALELAMVERLAPALGEKAAQSWELECLMTAALLHDIVEDAGMWKGVAYRFRKNGRLLEISGAPKILEHIGTEYGDGVQQLVSVLTMKALDKYEHYLAVVAENPAADKLKKIDKIDNLQSLELVPDQMERLKLVRKTLVKGWQQIRIGRDGWLSDLLLFALNDAEEWAISAAISQGIGGNQTRGNEASKGQLRLRGDQPPVHEQGNEVKRNPIYRFFHMLGLL